MVTCARDGCSSPTVGKSKYCPKDRTKAREAWKAMVADQAAAAEARKEAHQALFAQATAAGEAAAQAKIATVIPMVVQEHENQWDDNSPVVKSYFVPSGVCGFAWVTLRPGNCSFAVWAVKSGYARKAYQGGVSFRVPDTKGYEQSLEVKEAYARSFAGVLREAGLRAYPQSRMD